jgi:hypothetical protein
MSTVFDPLPAAVLDKWLATMPLAELDRWFQASWQQIWSRCLLRLRGQRLCKLLERAFKWHWSDYSDEENNGTDSGDQWYSPYFGEYGEYY